MIDEEALSHDNLAMPSPDGSKAVRVGSPNCAPGKVCFLLHYEHEFADVFFFAF